MELIVKIPDEDYKYICKIANDLKGRAVLPTDWKAIANGTPIIEGDVEKAVEILRNYHNGYFGYKIDDVKKAHNLAITALVTSSTRPKGEWIDRMADKGYVECPFCHKQITGGDLNFCVKCGAAMRGEENE